MDIGGSYSGNAVDAEFAAVVEEKKPATGSALAVQYELYRHPAMADKSTEYSKQAEHSMKLNAELGLASQAKMESVDTFKKDVDELTRTNDFFQISHQALNKLFQIGKMNRMCWGYNVRELFQKSMRPFAGNIICAVMTLGFLAGAFFTAGLWATPAVSAIMIIGRVFNVVAWIASICFGFGTFGARHSAAEYDFANVKLNIEPVETTSIKIPYGAKLKMKDAKETGIFESFTLAHPKFSTDRFIIEETKRRERPMSFDPAILGVTKDKRFYMICYWDIEHDIERTKDEIEKFLKFKKDEIEKFLKFKVKS